MKYTRYAPLKMIHAELALERDPKLASMVDELLKQEPHLDHHLLFQRTLMACGNPG